MKKFIFFLILWAMTSGLWAADTVLFTYHQDDRGKELQSALPPGDYLISVAENLFLIPTGTEFFLNIKRMPSYCVVHDRKVRHADGSISWFGYLKEPGKGYRISLIKGPDLIQGNITTPEGVFRVETRDRKLYLIDLEEKGIRNAATDPKDYKISHPDQDQYTASRDRIFSAKDNLVTTIDLMILYNQAFASKYPGASLQTRLNELVALSNQAYIDSAIYINLRLVHAEQVLYSNTIDSDTALDAMTDGAGAFAGVNTLRQQYGADLVMLLRPFDLEGHQMCGIAWLNGYNGSDISLYADKGFCVVSEGMDDQWNCDDLTFPHELGHNMGSAHDRSHASIAGVFPYSYGYGEPAGNAFGTIMSYYDPRLGYFSNPDILKCNGLPCGLPVSDINAANNALSMNNTRYNVAGFMTTSVNIPVQEIVIPYATNNGDYWAGLAIHNESDTRQAFTVSMFNAGGVRIGISDCIDIASGGTHTDMIENLIPETVDGRISIVIRTPNQSIDRFSSTLFMGKTGNSGQGFSFMSYSSNTREVADFILCRLTDHSL